MNLLLIVVASGIALAAAYRYYGSWLAKLFRLDPGAKTPAVTMRDLVEAVAAASRSDSEVVATVVYMVNAGRVRLLGRCAGARFSLHRLPSALKPCDPAHAPVRS